MSLCPRHQVELQGVTEGEWKGRVLICPVRGCDVNELLPTQQSQLKLTHLDPGRQYKATPPAKPRSSNSGNNGAG